MNFLATSGLLVTIASLFSVAICLLAGFRKALHTTWALFSLSVASWGFGLFKAFTTKLPDQQNLNEIRIRLLADKATHENLPTSESWRD